MAVQGLGDRAKLFSAAATLWELKRGSDKAEVGSVKSCKLRCFVVTNPSRAPPGNSGAGQQILDLTSNADRDLLLQERGLVLLSLYPFASKNQLRLEKTFKGIKSNHSQHHHHGHPPQCPQVSHPHVFSTLPEMGTPALGSPFQCLNILLGKGL